MRVPKTYFIRTLLAGTVLVVTPVFAQDMSSSLEMPAVGADDGFQRIFNGLSGGALITFFDRATTEERQEFLGDLPQSEIDSLLDSLSRDGSTPQILADVITDIMLLYPDARECALVGLYKNNLTLNQLEEVADILVTLVEQKYANLPPDIAAKLLLGGLCCDARLTDRVVLFANTLDAAGIDSFARVIVNVIDRAPASVASALETSIAIEGGRLVQNAEAVRRELLVAITEQASLPSDEAATVITTTTTATQSGRDAVFADAPKSSTGTGVAPGPTMVPPRRPPDISPVE
jgi:hypothetical protein